MPGLTVLVPLLVGAAVGSAIGHRPQIRPVTELAGHLPLWCIGVLLIVVGAQVPVRALRALATRTLAVLLAATLLPALLVLGYGWTWGAAGVLGVPLLTLASASMSVSNNMWTAIVQKIGTPADVAAGCVAAVVSSGPLVPLLVLAVWGGRSTSLPWALVLAAVLLLAGGILTGTVLPGSRRLLARLTTPLLLVMSAAMGWVVPLGSLVREAPAGVVVAVLSGVVTGGTAALLWARVLHRPAAIGWAAAAPAGVSVAVPTMVAIADPTWSQWVPVATAQTGAAVLAGIVLAAVLGAVTRPRAGR
ncbi:2-keto-3-deoxygluconate permease [Longispora sp. NPDC051575]|uniref:2-keto-3-deoxygluconate permease n=1 Tax=Longispora sp. NPDC051575 TaxID=3154943 RepID=UPI0034388332